MIAEQYRLVHSQVAAQGATLVAVSKFKTVENIQQAYDAGCRDFGENYVQELVDKQPQLPADIRWHLIGHLQTNKVKYIAPFVSMIQSVDSRKLVTEIQKQALKNQRYIQVLLQVHIAQEETKTGMTVEEVVSILQEASNFPNIQFAGLMGMASFTEDEEQVRKEFQFLKKTFDELAQHVAPDSFRHLSMGMSGDWPLAVKEGSTMVRIGSAIFGNR